VQWSWTTPSSSCAPRCPNGLLEDGRATEQGGSQTDHADFRERFPHTRNPTAAAARATKRILASSRHSTGGLECSCCAPAATATPEAGLLRRWNSPVPRWLRVRSCIVNQTTKILYYWGYSPEKENGSLHAGCCRLFEIPPQDLHQLIGCLNFGRIGLGIGA
jgi:hypothetical protein